MTPYDVLAIVGSCAWLYPISVIVYKIMNRPKLRITPANTIQIGYSGFGPIINLQCAISTAKKDALIERIEAQISHERGESHSLIWKFLDETQSTIMPFSGEGGGLVSKHDIAIALSINTSNISQKNIGFQDDDFHNRYNSVSLPFIEKVNLLKKTNNENYKEILMKSNEYFSLVEFLKNYIYWKAGLYKIKLIVSVATLKKPHIEDFKFELKQHEIDRLSKNLELLEITVNWAFLDDDLSKDSNQSQVTWQWINAEITRNN